MFCNLQSHQRNVRPETLFKQVRYTVCSADKQSDSLCFSPCPVRLLGPKQFWGNNSSISVHVDWNHPLVLQQTACCWGRKILQQTKSNNFYRHLIDTRVPKNMLAFWITIMPAWTSPILSLFTQNEIPLTIASTQQQSGLLCDGKISCFRSQGWCRNLLAGSSPRRKGGWFRTKPSQNT